MSIWWKPTEKGIESLLLMGEKNLRNLSGRNFVKYWKFSGSKRNIIVYTISLDLMSINKEHLHCNSLMNEIKSQFREYI